jgi:hypothetical protein
MKRVFFILAFLLIGIGFVSAYGLLGNFFDPYNLEMLMPAILFLFFFAAISYAAGKVFKDAHGNPNKATVAIISACISFFILYGIQRSGWDYETMFTDFFFDIGISADVLYPIIGIAILAFTAYLMLKLGLGAAFLIMGAIFSIISFTSLVYQAALLRVIGIVLIILGIFLLYRRAHKTYYVGRGW